MRSNVPNTQLVVALKRNPFIDRTNTLEMPRGNEVKPIQNRKQREHIKVDRSVPYSHSSQLNNSENVKPKSTSSENKVTFIERTKSKRIKKNLLKCPCCCKETDSNNVTCNSKPTPNETTSKKINGAHKSARLNVDIGKCHDPLFNMECKVNIERTNINKFLKPFPSKEENQTDTRSNNMPKTSSKSQNKVVINDQPLVNKKSPVHKELTVSLPKYSLLKSLRKQIRPDYAEITLDSSREGTPKQLPDIFQTCATKVPVYRQKLDDDKFKKPDKLYDFDESDSDINQQHKKKRRNAKKSKPTNSICTVFQFGDVKRKRVNKKTKRPVKKYDNIMDEVVKRVMKKVNDDPVNKKDAGKVKNVETKGVNTNKNINMQRISISKTNLPQNSEINKRLDVPLISTEKIVTDNQSIQHTAQGDINNMQSDTAQKNVPKNLSIHPIGQSEIENRGNNIEEIKMAKAFEDLSRSLFERSSDNKENTAAQNAPNKDEPLVRHTSPILHAPEENNEYFSENDNVDNNDSSSEQDDSLDGSFLDFGNNVHVSTPINKNNKIKVISNVLLKDRQSLKKRPKRLENPWRFSQAVKRNPHFIVLKSSALPCLKQDMVLDYDQVEKIEEHFSKTPRRFGTPKKSPIQTSILDYVNSPNRRDKENAPRPSLFDYDDFSPVKVSSPRRNEADKVKRNILGPVQDNASNILPFTSTPTKPFGSRQPFVGRDENDDVENCFGFDVSGSPIPREKGRRSDAKPFRMKEYMFKKQTKVKEVENMEDVPVQEKEPGESQITNEGLEVHIFDDPEEAFSLNVPSKIYLKKPRRKRLKSVDADNEDEHHTKKRKKDMMTKAEEAAMEDWAAKFNSMCREIEKHDLEIE